MPDEMPWFLRHDFPYIIVPKDLYRNPRYQKLSTEAKMMYGFFMDRTCLSYRTGRDWIDEQGEIFILFRQEEICSRLGCGHDKASGIMKELEKTGLIRRYTQRPGRPARIILQPFEPAPDREENPSSPGRKTGALHSGKAAGNKTEPNKPYSNHPHMDRRTLVKRLRENICYDALRENNREEILGLIVDTMADAILSREPEERIGSRRWGRKELREYLLGVNEIQAEYVCDHYERSTEEIRYLKKYILARLTEAGEDTIRAYYRALTRQDALQAHGA